ncbi:isochorismatase hydrolase [Alkalihalophilus pseudofirmus OF4]|uniref:Isochorismatase hydrolase n=1 Tax=Alkalihalophilus pseudofirmus (strain ATCC BAA-2126 / JCM 17055 / OF4) TaxID=398511 RepID=D3FST2_ALKPO|nr:isochorismatase family cysteine hydrolase [Alkalihalophilus pseudofirmus]ADC51797.1 isochorismatase hydrolase [Alkalihalophilus pseudofirmus OF4]
MSRKALLIVDMSYDFVADDGGLTVGTPAQTIVPDIVRTANLFLEKGDVVAVCMDAHTEDDPHFELWPKHNIIGTKGQELYGELGTWYDKNKENKSVLYIPKPEYDAFFNTNLEEELLAADVGEVYVVGVCTDICNFLTVYGAYARGFKTVAIYDQMTTFTQNQDVFIQQMESIFKTKIVYTSDLEKLE